MTNSTKRAYFAATSGTAAPSGMSIWVLGAALLLVALGWFAWGQPLAYNWVNSDWMLAVPVLWLAGLIWKGARRG